MKKLLVILSALCALLLFAVSASAYTLGDVDGNGEVEVTDARYALRAAVGLETYAPDSEAFIAADTDFNGELEVADARNILRAAVGLEDMADRLPESARLTEEEMFAHVRKSIVSVNYGYGFAVDDRGTIVTSFFNIEDYDAITVKDYQDRELPVEAVLLADQKHNIVVLKISGDVPAISVNHSFYSAGDAVYTVKRGDNNGFDGMAQGTILSLHQVLENRRMLNGYYASFFDMINVKMDLKNEYDYCGLPLLDRFGRAIGIICVDDIRTPEFSKFYVLPMWIMEQADLSEPMTETEFFKGRQEISLSVDIDHYTMLPNATGFIVVDVYGPYYGLLEAENHPSVSVIAPEGVDGRSVILKVYSSGPCKDEPLVIKTEDGSAKCTVYFTVSEDAYLNIPGFEFMPDLGALIHTEPHYYENRDFSYVALVYWVGDKNLSGEDIFYQYTAYLSYMGYEFVKDEISDEDLTISYYFYNEALDTTVLYNENYDEEGRLLYLIVDGDIGKAF